MTTVMENGTGTPPKKRGWKLRALRWLLILAGGGLAFVGYSNDDVVCFWIGLMALGLGVVLQVLAMIF